MPQPPQLQLLNPKLETLHQAGEFQQYTADPASTKCSTGSKRALIRGPKVTPPTTHTAFRGEDVVGNIGLHRHCSGEDGHAELELSGLGDVRCSGELRCSTGISVFLSPSFSISLSLARALSLSLHVSLSLPRSELLHATAGALDRGDDGRPTAHVV